MTKTVDNKSRRSFLKTGASATGGLLLGASAGCSQERQDQVMEINAVLPTPEQMEAFLALPDGPVLMVNLLKFTPDGGAEEYAKYIAGVRPILQSIGARIVVSGEAATCLIGNGDWDMVAIVEYPSPAAFFQMVNSDAYLAVHDHRKAGLEGQVLYAVLQHQGA